MWLGGLCQPQALAWKPQDLVSPPSSHLLCLCIVGEGLLSVADLSQLWPLHSS